VAQQHDDKGGTGASTNLVIPYTTDPAQDDLVRPVKPPKHVWWCPSIVTDQPPGTFTPGAPISVSVTVANTGVGTLIPAVNVYLWWTIPSTTWTNPLTLLGQQSIWLATKSSAVAPPITNVISISGDDDMHVCLLALAIPRAKKSTDMPPDPTNKTFWAQQNLFHRGLSKSGSFSLTFSAGNVIDKAATYDLVVRQASPEITRDLAHKRLTVPARDIRTELSLRAKGGTAAKTDGNLAAISIEMRRSENHEVTFEGVVSRQDGDKGLVILEIEQHLREKAHDPIIVGALGVALS
jgi:hypothetical protein